MIPRTANLLGAFLAFLSRPCCVLPALLSLFGAGTSGLMLALHPYRSIFLASATLSFAVSAFFTFRPGVSPLTKGLFVVSVLLTALFLSLS